MKMADNEIILVLIAWGMEYQLPGFSHCYMLQRTNVCVVFLISVVTALLLRSHYLCQIALRMKQGARVSWRMWRQVVHQRLHAFFFVFCLQLSVDSDIGDLSSLQSDWVSSLLHSATSPVEYQELHLTSFPNKETSRQFYLCQGADLEMVSSS